MSTINDANDATGAGIDEATKQTSRLAADGSHIWNRARQRQLKRESIKRTLPLPTERSGNFSTANDQRYLRRPSGQRPVAMGEENDSADLGRSRTSHDMRADEATWRAALDHALRLRHREGLVSEERFAAGKDMLRNATYDSAAGKMRGLECMDDVMTGAYQPTISDIVPRSQQQHALPTLPEPAIKTEDGEAFQGMTEQEYVSSMGGGELHPFEHIHIANERATQARRNNRPVLSAAQLAQQNQDLESRYAARENVREVENIRTRLEAHKERRQHYDDKCLWATETFERLRQRRQYFDDLFAGAKRHHTRQPEPTDPTATTLPSAPMAADPFAEPYSKARHLEAVEAVVHAEEALRAARLDQKPRSVGRKAVRRAQMAAGLGVPNWKAENRERRVKERIEESKKDPMDALASRMDSSLRLAKAKAKTGRKGGHGKGSGRRRLTITDVRVPRVEEAWMGKREDVGMDEGEMSGGRVTLAGYAFNGQNDTFMSRSAGGQVEGGNSQQTAMGGWQQGDGGVKLEPDDGDMEIE